MTTPLIQPAMTTTLAEAQGWSYDTLRLAEQDIPTIRQTAIAHCQAVLARQAREPEPTDLEAFALVLSELVTNAQRHTHGRTSVIVAVEPADLLVMVIDSSSQLPAVDTTDPGIQTHGLGLRLVAAYSDGRWGCTSMNRGKAVWARCSLSPET